MPRDTNGNYNLPSGNPVVTGTLITSGGAPGTGWANPTMEDIRQAMQESLSRYGDGGMEVPLQFVDGSGSVPGMAYVSEPTSGFRRAADADVRCQITTTDIWQATKTGVKVLTPDSGGMLKSPVVQESGQTVMRGEPGVTVAFFYNDTPPTGWTLEEPDANIRELVIGPSGGGEGGNIGGADDPVNLSTTVATTVTVSISTVANTSDPTVLDITQMPPHDHPYGDYNSNGNQGATGSGVAGSSTTGTTSPAGGGLGHSHGIPILTGSGTGTGAGTGTATPRYARGILAKLD